MPTQPVLADARDEQKSASVWQGSAASVAVAFVASRLVIVAVMVLSRSVVARGPYVEASHQADHGGTLLDLLTQWDGVWYRMIAEHGYAPPVPGLAAAFFPLYPLCVRYTADAVLNFQVAAVIVSNVSLIVAALLLFRLVRFDFDCETARRAVVLLMVGPVSFFFSAGYSESMFLLLSLAAALAARSQRWAIACITAACAGATRPTGFLVALLIGGEWLLHWRHLPTGERLRFSRSLVCFALLPVGLFGYFAYCYSALGDFFAPVHAHNVGWQQTLTMPWKTFFRPQNLTPAYIPIYQVVVAFGLGGVVAVCLLRMRVSYSIYAVASALFALLWASLDGVPRYFSAIFPIYIALAVCTMRVKWLYEPVLAIALGLLALCTVLFANAYQIT